MRRLLPVLIALCAITLAAGEWANALPYADAVRPQAEASMTAEPAREARPAHKEAEPGPAIDARPPGREPGVDVQWTAPYNVSNNTSGQYNAYTNARSVYVDASDNIHIVWSDRRTSSYDIYYSVSTDGGASFSTGVNIGDMGHFAADAYAPSIVGDNNGYLHVVWNSNYTGYYAIWYIRSINGGSTWSAPTRIYNPGNYYYVYDPYIACQPGGDNLHVVFAGELTSTSYRDALHMESTDGGLNWGTAYNMDNQMFEYAYGVTCDVLANDDVYCVWYQEDGGVYYRVFLNKRISGTWNGAEQVQDSYFDYEDCYDPSVVVDGDGDIHVAWDADPNTGSSYNRIWYRVWDSGTSSWGSVEQISQYDSYYSYSPNLSIGPITGRMLCTYRGRTATAYYYHPLYTYRQTGGWATPEDADPTNYCTYYRYEIQHIVDSGENLHLLWYSYYPLYNDEVYYVKGPAPAPNDVGISGISFSGYTLVAGQSYDVAVTIQNHSFNAQTSIPVSYTVDGSTVNETWTGTLPGGGTAVHTFATQWTPATVGKRQIDAATALGGDPVPGNDQFTEPEISVWPLKTVAANCFNGAAFPPNGWTTEVDPTATVDWTRATTSNHPTGYLPVDGAAMAYYYNYGESGLDGSKLITHSFTWPEATYFKANFWHLRTSSYSYADDTLYALYSTDGGTTWNEIAGWRNHDPDNPGWVNVDIQTPTIPASTPTLFALYAVSDWYHDTHVDSLRVFVPPDDDVGITEIVQPAGGYGIDQQIWPEVTLKNLGKNPQAGIPVYCEVWDGGTMVYSDMETYTDVLDPGVEVAITFDTPFNTGFDRKVFDIYAYTDLTGDEEPGNDTAAGSFAITILQWYEMAPVPGPVDGIYRTAGCTNEGADADYFYVVGGQSGSNVQQDALYRYDIAANTWTTLATMPSAKSNLRATYVPTQDKIYIFGGYNGSSGTNDVYIYDVATDAWSTGANPVPAATYSTCNAWVGDTIYVIDGDTMYAYCVLDGTWAGAPAPPTTNGSYGFTAGVACALDGKVYVSGGWTASAEFMSYDPATGTWTVLDPLPVGRNGHGMVPMDGYIFVFGGGSVWTPLPAGEGNVYYYDPANPGAGWNSETYPLDTHHAGAFGSGSLIASCGTYSAGNSSNYVEKTTTPVPSDPGVVSIQEPVGYLAINTMVTPRATFRNYHSTNPATFDAHFYLYDPTDVEVYHNTLTYSLGPGDEIQLSFLPFNLGTNEGQWTAKCSTFTAEGDYNHANDMLSQWFVVSSNPWPEGWSEVAAMPTAPSGKPVKDGGWLAIDQGTDAGLIYGLKGNKTGDFYVYDAMEDSWTTLASMPQGAEGKPPRKGSRGICDGAGYLYATKGNNTFGFWKYDIANDSWSALPNVPEGPRGKKVKGGTDMVYVVRDDTGYVYLMKGYKTEFYRYNTVTGAWDLPLPNLPWGRKEKWDKGSWLAFDGMSYIYAHQAKYYNRATEHHYMFRYDLDNDSFTSLLGMPLWGLHGSKLRKKKAKDGGSAAYLPFSDEIYSLKGGNSQQFFKYIVAEDTWTEIDTMPSFSMTTGRRKRVKHGADIVHYDGPAFFALKGNKTVEFWRYVIPFGTMAARPERSGVAGGRTELPLGVTVAPNPIARGWATVRYSLPHAGPATLKVFDVTGRSVSRHSLVATRTGAVRLDLRDLSAGIYLVKLETEAESFTQKLVVQH